MLDLTVGTIILATGFKDFDPARIPELATANWTTCLPPWNSNA